MLQLEQILQSMNHQILSALILTGLVNHVLSGDVSLTSRCWLWSWTFWYIDLLTCREHQVSIDVLVAEEHLFYNDAFKLCHFLKNEASFAIILDI